ncbi:MAG: hypothetical protein Q4C70_15800, partial [Planctomycetia bacterium]|nr:hypothetical protein [Planctomycetia bacterium]
VTGNAGLTGNTGNTGSSRHVGSVGNTRNAGISGTSVSAEIVGNGKNGVISENTGNRVNGENIINGVNYGSNYDANYGMVTDASGLPAPFPVDKREFHLPFGNFLSVLPAEQLREIRLYVSRDNGNTWHTYQTLTREQIQKLPNKNFGVRTNTDGEIWFSLRVVNLQGTETPGESKQPTWRVLVNTTGKPLNTVVNNGNRTGNQAENAVRNQSGTVAGASSGTLNGENPPSGNIFAAPGMLNRPQWTPTADGKPTGNALADGNGTVSENRAAQNPNLVVYSVKDRGTNTIPDASLPVYKIPNSRPIEAFQNFTADGSGNESGSGNTKQHATAKPMDDGLGDLSGLDSLDGNDAISGDSASSGDSVSENDSTASSDDMFLMLGDAPGADDGLNTRIRYINQPGLSVDYDVSTVGSSGVGRVELWGTLDDGQTWTYMAEDKDCTSPVNLNLKSDGKYGFQILIFNGAGVGMERPQAGSAPQMEVVLDRINPRVQLYTIQLQAEFGDLEITWGAEDLNLGTNPVLLSWSSSTEGPWRAMTSVPLENTGRFVWRIPDGVPGKVYIRLDVCDLSKNSTTLVTGPVVTDIMRPTGVILDAKPTN